MLESVSALVVLADDPIVAAHVALGIGRVQAHRRRVAIGDLVGEVEPLQSLLGDDDSHGITDSFLYGVSLNKIARPVDASGNLFIMPSGSEPVADPEIFRSDRWRRLAAGFREVDALLLLVVRASSDGVPELAAMLDGVVTAGDAVTTDATARGLRVVATARATRPGPRPSASAAPPVAEPTPTPKSGPRTIRWLLAAVLVVGALGYGTVWWSRRATAEPLDDATLEALTPAAQARPSPSPPGPSRDTLRTGTAVNPGDSSRAAAFAVELLATNTVEGANLLLREKASGLPAATHSPVLLDSLADRWYKVIAGAFALRSQADSLLRAVRTRGIVASDRGRVIRTPLAMRLQDSVARDSATTVVGQWRRAGVPAYALLQENGRAAVFVGAFETPEQGELLAASLRASGITAVLAYRTGRAF